MNHFRKTTLVAAMALCGILTVAYAASPSGNKDSDSPRRNSYNFYTNALRVEGSGVVAVPSRFKWSVETSWSGTDVQGNNLPDSRVMLRLYDPDRNFTALTAQMDLATAAILHHELGEIIVKKLQDADYQHRPQLYSSDKIPTGRILGVDENGVAEIEFGNAAADPSTPAPK